MQTARFTTGPFGFSAFSRRGIVLSTDGIDLGLARNRDRLQRVDRSRTKRWHIACSNTDHHTTPLTQGLRPMSSKKIQSSFASIDPTDLAKVAGGASRVSSRAGGDNTQLTAMLTSITDSIKGLAGKQQGGMDPMMMMMMMMMMGGGGGGAAPAAAPAAAPQPPPLPVINVSVKRGC
jgi:hypothetical protein